jgi:hypothetical protein
MQARTSPASVSVKLSSRACAREAALLSSCRSSRPPNSDIAPPGRRPLLASLGQIPSATRGCNVRSDGLPARAAHSR